MSSYVITGVSRGLGFEFLRQLSEDPANTVFGLVRNKADVESKVAAEIPRKNIHIIQADTTDPQALKKAAQHVSDITNGSLDYIIANAALQGSWGSLDGFDVLSHYPEKLEKDLIDHFRVNAVGPIHLFNAFMPLILQGRSKKVIAISTGNADPDLVRNFDVYQGVTYTISKAALNMAVSKFSAVYRNQGVLCLSICPGSVATGNMDWIESDEDKQKAAAVFEKFLAYAPNFTGPVPPEDAVKSFLGVVEKASIEGGYAGDFVSHNGNKQWLP